MNCEYWFRSSVTLPRLFAGETVIENDVFALASSWRQARAKARYKVWRAARAAGYHIGFGDVKLTPTLMPLNLESGAEVIW